MVMKIRLDRFLKILRLCVKLLGANLEDVVKLNVYLARPFSVCSLSMKIMQEFFSEPYPARAASSSSKTSSRFIN